MPNVLIRDVPDDDLDQIRSAAAERGTSLQNYLRDAVHAQVAYLRRQAALARTAERLNGRPPPAGHVRDASAAAMTLNRTGTLRPGPYRLADQVILAGGGDPATPAGS